MGPWSIAVTSVITAIISVSLYVINRGGGFRSLPELNFEKCETIAVDWIVGAEDIDTVANRMYFTFDDREYWDSEMDQPGNFSRRIELAANSGGLGVFDSESEAVHHIKITGMLPELVPDFHPHGITVEAFDEQFDLIAVVNHRRDGESIELFLVQHLAHPHVAVFVATLSESAANTPSTWRRLNDLVLQFEPTLNPAKPESVILHQRQLSKLLISNFVYADSHTTLGKVEQFTMRRWNYVLQCELPPRLSDALSTAVKSITSSQAVVEPIGLGLTCSTVVPDLFMANGLALSPAADSGPAYVAIVDTLGFQVTVHKLQDGGQVNVVPELILPTVSGCDNVVWADDDRLWLGCHPSVLQFARHVASHGEIPTYSEVMRSKPLTPLLAETTAETVVSDGFEVLMMHNGTVSSASSAACPYRDAAGGEHYLVGFVTARGLLKCSV